MTKNVFLRAYAKVQYISIFFLYTRVMEYWTVAKNYSNYIFISYCNFFFRPHNVHLFTNRFSFVVYVKQKRCKNAALPGFYTFNKNEIRIPRTIKNSHNKLQKKKKPGTATFEICNNVQILLIKVYLFSK